MANANLLTLVQTVTDADGDVDTAAINLGTGVFQIEDDGPDAVVANAVVADDCAGRDAAGWDARRTATVLPAGLDTVTVNLAGNFAAVADFGSDGPWQRDLFAGADRFERGVRAVCAWMSADATGDLDRARPGRRRGRPAWHAGTVGGGRTTSRITLNPATGQVTFTPAQQHLARQHRSATTTPRR